MEPLWLLLVLLAIWVIVSPFVTVSLLLRHRKLRDQIDANAAENSRRLSALQRELAELQRQFAASTRRETPATHEAAASPPGPLAPASPIADKELEPELEKKPPEPVRVSPPSVTIPPRPQTPPMPPRPAEPVIARPAAQPTPPPPKPPPPHTTVPSSAAARISTPSPVAPLRVSPPKPTLQQRMKKVSSIEETLGTNWLNKLGVIILVVGVALFGIYELQALGAAGKASISYAAGLALLAGGIFLEKRETYRLLGRTGIGGGWALLFFSTYAINHVSAMQVLNSELVDLLLMLLVALAMAAHTLRYRSQVVTGFAFLLGYTTVALSHDNVYSLSAGVVLAIGLVAIVIKMGWFELEVFGILSSYLNHLYWLYRILGIHGAHGRHFEAYHASLAMLIFYWLIFRISYVARRIKSDTEEHVSTVAALLNTLLLLGIMKFQSVQPELAYIALLVVGAVELIFAHLPRTKSRREAFVTLGILGSALVITAVPFHYSGNNVAILWLVGTEVFLAAGLLGKEAVFRRVGLLTGLLVGIHLAAIDFPQLVRLRETTEALALSAGVIFALCGSTFYVNALFIGQRWTEFFESALDTQLLTVHSYLGALSAAAAVWAFLPHDWVAVGWIVLAVLLALSVKWVKYRQLAWQANAIAVCAVARALLFNYDLNQKIWPGLSLRIVTVTLVAAGLYFLSRKAAPEERFAIPTAFLHSFAATGLLTLLAWYEAPNGWLAAIWAGFALVLALVDRRFELDELRWQAHGLALLTLIRSITVNLYVTATWHNLSVRLISLAIVAVVFYALSRVVRIPEEWRERDFHHIYSWCASAVVSLLLWYELQPLSVAVGWAVFGLVLFEYGLLRHIVQLRYQAYVALMAAFARIFFANLNAGEPGVFWGPRTYTIAPLALIFFFVYAQLPENEQQENVARDRKLHLDALVAYLGTATIVALFYFQFPIEWVVTSWAALVFVLFGLALALDRPLFLHQGLLLTVGTLARGMVHNLFGSGYFGEGDWKGRYFVLGSAVAILLASLIFAFRLRNRGEAPSDEGGLARILAVIVRRPEQLQFFAPIVLLTFMLALKMRAGMVTVAWGIEGVLIMLFALAVRERSYRLAGLAMLLLCVAKVLALDAWGLQPRDRYITFIIVGAALLVVSFLYSKHRETIRQFL